MASSCRLLRGLVAAPVARQLTLGRALGADLATKEKERGMSSAMRMYLQRKKEHDMFISRERAEFEVGKQHLAGMMGLDAASMEQADIDRSVEYLFPSGLADIARPVMKPPEEIFPRYLHLHLHLILDLLLHLHPGKAIFPYMGIVPPSSTL